MWAPCLDGPVTHTDTMDEAGPSGPAWMRPSGLLGSWLTPHEESDEPAGWVVHQRCKCVALCCSPVV